jgi:hypothetical protein
MIDNADPPYTLGGQDLSLLIAIIMQKNTKFFI